MSGETIRMLKTLLENKRRELLRGTSDRDEILIEHTADEFDRLQQQMTRDVAIRNLDREAILLKSVQSALARMDDETYGVCLHCDEEIPERRLRAIPWASYCLECQERIEKHEASNSGTVSRNSRARTLDPAA